MTRQLQSQSTQEANTEDMVPKLEVGAPHEGHKINPRGHEMITKIRKHSPLPSDLSFMIYCIKRLLIKKKVQNLGPTI